MARGKSEHPAPSSARGEARRPELHVLLVDDDDEQRESVLLLLKGTGCRVDTADNGANAVRQLGKGLQPDVILMDLTMPIMDGWEAMRRIRDVATKHRPYIVALSALPDAEARRRAFEAGCDEYVVKPFDVREVLRSYVARAKHRTFSGV